MQVPSHYSICETSLSIVLIFLIGLQKMLLGGCSNVSQQTLVYSGRSQKFAYLADAHVYVYDTTGLCRLDSIIPFCENIQSKHVEEQKQESNLPNKVDKLRSDESKFVDFVFGIETGKEIWGGVGISCIDWSPLEDNLLAAVTLKTDRLEIWNV